MDTGYKLKIQDLWRKSEKHGYMKDMYARNLRHLMKGEMPELKISPVMVLNIYRKSPPVGDLHQRYAYEVEKQNIIRKSISDNEVIPIYLDIIGYKGLFNVRWTKDTFLGSKLEIEFNI